MTNTRTRRAQILRDRARSNRTASAARRAALHAARRVRTGPRSLVTHVIATGADAATIKGVAAALRNVASRNGIKGRRTRTRRTFGGALRHAVNAWRYTRAQVAQIAAAYKPRKAEYKAVRAALLAAA
ncbi:hypothetical protein ACIQWY_29840 [Streptomyces albidoflavus]